MRRVVPVAATAAALALLTNPVAGAGSCSDAANKALYDSALAQIDACASIVGFPLEPPLPAPRTASICRACPTLLAATRAKQFGDCTLASGSTGTTTTLQARMESLFVCMSSPRSSSGSGSGVIVAPTPTPTPGTPKPSSIKSLSGSGSGSTVAPTPKTPKPPTPSASSEESGSDSGSNGNGTSKGGNNRGSSSSNGQTPGASTASGSDVSIGLVVGIAAGVVVLVILIATVVVCQQRRRSRRQSRQEPLVYSEEHTPQSKHQAQIISSGGGGTGSARASSVGATAGSAMARGSVSGTFMMPQGSGGLWEDDAIVAVRIPREKVISEALLSRGGYGEVYRGVYNGHSVAIKTLLPERRKDMKQINGFLAEVKLMAALEHDQIVRFIGVAWDSLTDLCVVSEYMEGGDLRAALNRFEEIEHRPHGFDHDKVKIALHISHALTYLHSLRPTVLHRDLKSKNILLDKQLNAKLTDFGVSRERSDRTMTAGVGSSLWMAPEVMLGERYDEKSDIFSFGVVLSELDSHLMPYSQVTESSSSGESRRIPDTAILQMVSLGRLHVQFSPLADPKMVEIALACVALDPTARPTAADILYKLHSVLKSYQG